VKGAALLTIVAALGMRHGVDPDHLAAIDGLTRFHPSRWNGVLFALGHGILVTILAVGFGTLLARVIAPYTAWILLALGFPICGGFGALRAINTPKRLACFGQALCCLASSSAWDLRRRVNFQLFCSRDS
jgi:hypothetical protein